MFSDNFGKKILMLLNLREFFLEILQYFCQNVLFYFCEDFAILAEFKTISSKKEEEKSGRFVATLCTVYSAVQGKLF